MPREGDGAKPRVVNGLLIPDRFSDSFLRKLKCPPERKEITLFETGGTGLAVRVQNSGVISLLLQHRLRDGRRWREVLGRHPTLTVENARAALQARVGSFAMGVDPFETRAAAKAEIEAKAAAKQQAKVKANEDKVTLKKLLNRWNAEHLVRERRASYAFRANRAVEITCKDLLETPVYAITRPMVRAALDEARERRGPGAARQAGATIRALYTWAAKMDIIAPSQNILQNFQQPPPTKKRERALSIGEVRRVWQASEALTYPAREFIRLLVLTGLRRDEIRLLVWDEVKRDDEGDGFVIDLPSERVKQGRTSGGHRTHLSSAALAVIRSCPLHDCPFVFTSDGKRPMRDTVRPKAKLDELLKADGGPRVEHWILHDLRRTMIKALTKRGHNPLALDHAIGHKPSSLSDIALIYNTYKFENERRTALEDWGKLVTNPPGDNVVPLRVSA